MYVLTFQVYQLVRRVLLLNLIIRTIQVSTVNIAILFKIILLT
jgi:hypothetical protein